MRNRSIRNSPDWGKTADGRGSWIGKAQRLRRDAADRIACLPLADDARLFQRPEERSWVFSRMSRRIFFFLLFILFSRISWPIDFKDYSLLAVFVGSFRADTRGTGMYIRPSLARK
jgi:hypothetical protein